MTHMFDLSHRFSELAYPASPAFNGRFGHLDSLASWLVATKVPMRTQDSMDRELVLFGEDQRASGWSSLPPGMRKSQSPISNVDRVDSAIEYGIQTADRAIDAGVALLFLSSQKTESPHALEILVGTLTRTDAASVASRKNVGDSEWIENVTHIRDEMFLLRDDIGDPLALLGHTKSFGIAAMVGVILQSAKRATPVVLFGEAASCAALIATRISHRARSWTIPAVDLVSPVGALTQRHLDRPPILELGMEFGYDYLTPLAMTAPIIDAMLALLST
jgi:NaMN:DMB phosphoribosyltransferase